MGLKIVVCSGPLLSHKYKVQHQEDQKSVHLKRMVKELCILMII